jgi:hypothetical protein
VRAVDLKHVEQGANRVGQGAFSIPRRPHLFISVTTARLEAAGITADARL